MHESSVMAITGDSESIYIAGNVAGADFSALSSDASGIPAIERIDIE